jgi:hypothetical protein
MPRKPTKWTATTVKTTIGGLSSGEVVALESLGRDMFLTINGVKIARRVLHPKLNERKSWIPVNKGWIVIDTDGPLSLQIKHNGKILEWSPLTLAPGS